MADDLRSKLIELGFASFVQFSGPIVNDLMSKHRESPPEQTQESECITCQIYQHVALAHAYIIETRDRVNPDGSIPAGLGGAIEQARQHIKIAMSEIPQIIGYNAMIDSACSRLSDILPECLTYMQNIKSPEEWSRVCSLLTSARTAAYAIPEAVYRRDTLVPETSQEHLAVILEPEEKELFDVLSKARKGEITESESKATLAKMLFPGEYHDGKS